MRVFSKPLEELSDAPAVIGFIIIDEVLFATIESEAGKGNVKFASVPFGFELETGVHGAVC
jgi:hypothetical protein